MPGYLNIADFIKIGLMSVVFVLLANKLLDKIGLDDLQA